MPRPRDLLARFRPAGTPGAAAPGGVPADRVAELSAELAPVLELLAEAQEQAHRIRAEAGRVAEQRRARGEERARELVAAARREAAADRAEEASRIAAEAHAETETTLAHAVAQAAAVRRRGQQRLPGYVDRVVTAVYAELGVPVPSTVPPGEDPGR